MKIGICMPTKYYEMAARMGYDYFEVPGVEMSAMSETAFNAFAEKVKKTGLPVKGYNAYCNASAPVVGDEYSAEKAISYAQKMAALGKVLGIETIGVGSPAARKLPKGYPIEKADSQAIEFLKLTSAEAAKHGQKVLFEAVHSHMTDYCNMTEHAMKIARESGVGLIIDFYHAKAMGEDIKNMGGLVKNADHIHISRLLPDYGRMFVTNDDMEFLMDIKNAIVSGGYDGTISLEPDDCYFEEYGAESLNVMRDVFC
ncbi:MAG: sugar phosphate isomerase/epimerase [Firmicutes bacterium]|nr:sugar phosphate isomerase/epimerase [Bacillota bacterium]